MSRLKTMNPVTKIGIGIAGALVLVALLSPPLASRDRVQSQAELEGAKDIQHVIASIIDAARQDFLSFPGILLAIGMIAVEKRFAFSIKDTSELLGLSVSTIAHWICEGRISSYKIGGRRLIPKDEIDRLLAQARVERIDPADL